MNMVNINKFFLFLFICLVGCGKKQKTELANNYYELSSLELKDDNDAYYKRALLYVEKAIEQDERPEFVARKATLLFKLGRQEESLLCFELLLSRKMDPYIKAEILNNYACVLGQSGKLAKALEMFTTLEKSKNYLTPEVALVNQSKIYSEMGKDDLAQKKLLRATQLANNYVDAHYYLAVVSSSLDDQKRMQEELQTTLFLEPEHEGAKSMWNRLL
jgi:tetratricopeptide (TPR) repeat protein